MVRRNVLFAVMVLFAASLSFAQVQDAKFMTEVFIQALASDDADMMKKVVESNDEQILDKVFAPNYAMTLNGVQVRGTPLQFAATNGNIEAVKCLLEYVAAKPERAGVVLAVHKQGLSVLHLAIRAGHKEIAQVIIEFSMKHDFALDALKARYGVASVLLYVAQLGDVKTVQLLLELAKNPVYTKELLATDVQDFNALHYATHFGYPDLIRVLLSSPFRDKFLENAKSLGVSELSSAKRKRTWMTLIEYAPQLAMNPLHKSLESVGQCEAAFFLRNATLLNRCDQYRINLNLTLLFAMFSHVENLDESVYMDFIWEKDPFFYIVAVPLLRIYEWLFIKYTAFVGH